MTVMATLIVVLVGLVAILWLVFIVRGVPSKHFRTRSYSPAARDPTSQTTEQQYREYFSVLYDQEVDRVETLDQIRRASTQRQRPPQTRSNNEKG